MQFTKAEIDAQRNFVEVLRWRFESTNNALNEAYRQNWDVYYTLYEAKVKLDMMEDSDKRTRSV